MKKMLFSFFALMIVTSLIAQQSFVSDKLTKKWETPAQLKVPESVCFDAVRNVIYASNIGGSPTDKDGNGFIAKISPEGQILILEWVKGLNSPKGMGIVGDFLFVSDITRVVKIDIAQGKVAGEIDIPGSQLLNDVATDQQGNVYVSDMNGNAVYMIKGGKPELLVKSEKLNGPNGLYFSGDRLLAGLQDRIVSIDIRTREIKDYISNTGGIDGLVTDGNGNFLISYLMGHIHLVSPQKDKAGCWTQLRKHQC
jgi:outer membrane protein assembly factor BamB